MTNRAELPTLDQDAIATLPPDPPVPSIVALLPPSPTVANDPRLAAWQLLYHRSQKLSARALDHFVIALGHLAELNEWEQLAVARRAHRLAGRAKLGREVYGPFEPSTDARDMRAEMRDENLDDALYDEFDVIKQEVRR